MGSAASAILNGSSDTSSDPNVEARADIVVATVTDNARGWAEPNSPPGCVPGNHFNACDAAICSAVFVTPTRLLIAQHCVTGDTFSGATQASIADVSVGAYGGAPLHSGASTAIVKLKGAVTYTNGPIADWQIADDMAILEVDTSAIDKDKWQNILTLGIERPSLVAPTTQAVSIAGYGCTTSNTGCENAEWSPTGFAPYQRNIATIPSISLVNGMWQWTACNNNDPSTWKGDSGGPLFYLRGNGDGTRDVFGLTQGGDFGGGCITDKWVDLTSSAHVAWLNAHIVDSDSNHTTVWNAKHPYPQGHSNRWFGETDYTGPCQQGDTDCDGWYDAHDNCPLDFNPTQHDSDDDGNGDACPCPCDDANEHQDKDHDGFCAVACPTVSYPNAPPQMQDNCPTVTNLDQANCNYDAEIAQRLPVLGDACDPVPCPSSSATAITRTIAGSSSGNPQLGGSQSGRQVRDRVDMIGIRSEQVDCNFVQSGPNNYSYDNVCAHIDPTGVATSYRFCQYNPFDQTKISDCYDLNQIDDAALTQIDDRTHTNWHHITFGTDARGQDYPLDYNQLLSPSGSGVPPTSRTWSYLTDQSYWLTQNPQTIPSPWTYSACTNTAYGGDGSLPNSGVTCLSGRLWSHADNMPLGDSVTSQNGVTVGYHGAQLANHYFPDIQAAGLVDGHFNYIGGTPTTFYRPDGTYSWTYAGIGAWHRIFLWKTLPDPWEVVTAQGHVSGVLAVNATGSQLGVLQDDGTNAQIYAEGPSAIVDSALQTELRSSSYVWASNVDPSAAVGTISGGVEGVALSADGTSTPDVAINVGGVLKTRTEAGFPDFVTRSEDPHPQPRTGFTAFYSGAAGGVFMLGGSQSGTALHDIWFRGMANDWWSVSAYTFDMLLAATYSFGDRKLYVLDHSVISGTDTARLVRIDLQANALDSLGSWPFTPVYTQYALTPDVNGSVLLVASKPSSTRIGRLVVDGSGTAYASAIDTTEQGSLAFGPVVDPGGYAVTTLDPESGVPTTRRYTQLPFGAPGSYALGSFFPQPIANGGFESGSLSSWTATGQSETVSTVSGRSGIYSALLGSTSPTSGDSTIQQPFTVPAGGGTLKLWYSSVCPDTVVYDWFTATLLGPRGDLLATIVPKTCASSSAWTEATLDLSSWKGWTVRVVLTSHDDGYPYDPTYTFVDDVTVN